MKKFMLLIIFGCLLAAGGSVALAAETGTGVFPGNSFVAKGTLIDVEIAGRVDSGQLEVGDIVYFKTVNGLIVDGVIVVPGGTAGEAVVTDIRQANFFGRGGGITLTAKSLLAKNGAVIPLTMEIKKYGGDDNYVFATILFGGRLEKLKGAGAVLRGSDQVIPVGTRFLVAVDADADLGCRPDRLPIVMAK